MASRKNDDNVSLELDSSGSLSIGELDEASFERYVVEKRETGQNP